ncbi:MAG: hypothetical protein MPN21_24235 [Thermoanaerobaculia bacterium]|nr:hypothetical protein [Thermoanaerobaculia bacterium]
MRARRRARRPTREEGGDRTVFLQDVLSNALIAVLVLATVSMTQIAIGGMERHAGQQSGPHQGLVEVGEERTLDAERREIQLPPTTRTVWVLAELPDAKVMVSASPLTLMDVVARWRAPDDGSGRHKELWRLDLSAIATTTEQWTFAFADGPQADPASFTVLGDDRRLTSGDGPVTMKDTKTLLDVVRSPGQPIRVRVH